MHFCLEIGRSLSNVTKQTKNYISEQATFHSTIYIPPSLSVHFRQQYLPFFLQKCVKINWKLIIINVVFIDLMLNMKIGDENMRIWSFNNLLDFKICWPVFTMSWFTQLFFSRLLEWHLMHYISWKNLVIDTFFSCYNH